MYPYLLLVIFRSEVCASNAALLGYKDFSKIVLQKVIPLKYWQMIARYIPMWILFECLDTSLTSGQVRHVFSVLNSLSPITINSIDRCAMNTDTLFTCNAQSLQPTIDYKQFLAWLPYIVFSLGVGMTCCL